MRYFKIEKKQDYILIKLLGNWDKYSVKDILKESLPKAKRVVFDLSEIKDFDSAGVVAFIKICKNYKKKAKVEIINYTQKQKELYELLKDNIDYKIPQPKNNIFKDIGIAAADFIKDALAFFNFSGRLFVGFLKLFKSVKNIRFQEIVYHIYQSGVTALIIVGITAFLVGIVIAYQTGVQLSKFGASIFIVDTVGISITRELGPMITAIVIAGRSASAYAAEIGAMKLTDEIDAMKTFGFDPYIFLVIPRIIALIIALPLLIFFADIIGIFGGALAAKMQLGISFEQFINRIYEALKVKHYILGLIKAPFFAFIIAAIGSFRGFEVQNNTESLGLKTTQAVVNSIFLVIAIDAFFSVIYTELGL